MGVPGKAQFNVITASLLVASLFLLLAFAFPFVSNDFVVSLTKDDYVALMHNVAKKRKKHKFAIVEKGISVGVKRSMRAIEKRLTPDRVSRMNAFLTDYAIHEGGVKVGDYYLWETIKALWSSREHAIAIAIFLFSVLFPIAKIAGTFYCHLSFAQHFRLAMQGKKTVWDDGLHRTANFIGRYSKWSMADVFIVALIVVMYKAVSFNYEFKAELGIYCYLGSFLLSSFAIHFVSKWINGWQHGEDWRQLEKEAREQLEKEAREQLEKERREKEEQAKREELEIWTGITNDPWN